MTNSEQKKRFADKLKSAMIEKGLEARASVLEREFNLKHFGNPVTIQGASKWLRGESIPRPDKVITLAKWLEIEPSELVYGIKINEEIAEKKQRWQDAISYQEREIFEAFLNLPAPQRKVVREVILAFSRAYDN